jgi:hypothetical protein
LTANLLNSEQKQFYYVEVYQATDKEQDVYRETLTGILKTFFECLKLNQEVEKAEGLQGSLPTTQPEKILTIKVAGSSPSDLPKVSVSDKREALIPFYQRLADKFFETYKDSVDYDDVVSFTRVYQHFTLEQLKGEMQRLTEMKKDLIYIRTYQEYRRAGKILDATLGHPDAGVRYEKLKGYRESVEMSEQLYLEAMLLLKREGLGYFEADRASARLAFLNGTDDAPYIFEDTCPPFRKHNLTHLQVHSNPALMEWFEKEKEETEIKKTIWMDEYYKDQQERAIHRDWQNKVSEWLTRFIENDGIIEELRVEIQKSKLSENDEKEVLEMYEKLKLTVAPKKIRARVKED